MLLIARTMDAPSAVPVRRAVTFNQTAPPGTTLTSGGVLSGDGRYLAFVARHASDGKTRLWVRTLESSSLRALPGTENAFRPFWSPDGQWVAFFADGRLKKVGLAGAPPQTLTTVGYRPSGGTWSRRGAILYSDRMSPIYSVPDSGTGAVTEVTGLDASRQETAHYEPQFLPDGRHFLYFADSISPERRGTYIGSVDGEPSVRLLDGSSAAVTYAAPRHVLFVRDKVLMAQPFDTARLRLSGPEVPLGDGLSSESLMLSTSTGLLTFGGDAAAQHLAWFDRAGRSLGALETSRNLHNPVFSPDQRQLAADNQGIWIVDLERGAPTRIAPDGVLPTWSADGTAVVFTSREVSGATDLRARPVMGRGDDDTLLVRSKEMKLSGDWSRNGRQFVYVGSDPKTRLDVSDGAMMSVDISPGRDGPQPAKPRLLFRVPLNGDITRYRNHYAVTADGQRFLVDTADESTREPITVIVNWDALIGSN